MTKSLSLVLASLIFLGPGCVLDNFEEHFVPITGVWDFNMDASAEDLSGSCSGMSMAWVGGRHTSGSAQLAVSQDGALAHLQIDNQSVMFSRQMDGSYASTPRMFSVRGVVGSVWFDFVPNTVDTIVGTLHWDNNRENRCQGDYPFTMVLVSAGLPNTEEEPITLLEGDYALALSDAVNDCDGSIVNFSGVPSIISISETADLDTGLPAPGNITVEPMGIFMEQLPGTSRYAQVSDPFDAGMPEDAAGDILMDYEDQAFSASFEFTADAANHATGTLYISGPTCGMTANVTLNLIP